MERRLKLEMKMRGCLGAICALATMLLLLPSQVPAQTSASGASETSKTASHSGAAQATSNTAAKSPHTTKSSTSTKPHSSSHSSSTASHAKSTTTQAHSGKSKYAKSRKGAKGKTVARGQQKIAPERAEEIQEALVREHYLNDAAGTWNQATEDAMRRYQADHGWQSKTVPDARALIALGLGPSHDHLLNPESAMTTEPESPHATAVAPSSQSPDPGATPVQQNSTSPQ